MLNHSPNILIEICSNCKSHQWCTRHNQLQYEKIAVQISNHILAKLPNSNIQTVKVSGNKMGSFEIFCNQTQIFSKRTLGYFPHTEAVTHRIVEFLEGRLIIQQNCSPIKRRPMTGDSPLKNSSPHRKTATLLSVNASQDNQKKIDKNNKSSLSQNSPKIKTPIKAKQQIKKQIKKEEKKVEKKEVPKKQQPKKQIPKKVQPKKQQKKPQPKKQQPKKPQVKKQQPKPVQKKEPPKKVQSLKKQQQKPVQKLKQVVQQKPVQSVKQTPKQPLKPEPIIEKKQQKIQELPKKQQKPQQIKPVEQPVKQVKIQQVKQPQKVQQQKIQQQKNVQSVIVEQKKQQAKHQPQQIVKKQEQKVQEKKQQISVVKEDQKPQNQQKVVEQQKKTENNISDVKQQQKKQQNQEFYVEENQGDKGVRSPHQAQMKKTLEDTFKDKNVNPPKQQLNVAKQQDTRQLSPVKSTVQIKDNKNGQATVIKYKDFEGQVDKLFTKLNRNKDQSIEANQIKQLSDWFLKDLQMQISQQTRSFFNTYFLQMADTNKDGKISYEQFKKICWQCLGQGDDDEDDN